MNRYLDGEAEARDLEVIAEAVLAPDTSEGLRGGILGALKGRPLNASVLTPFAKHLRQRAITPENSPQGLIDTCGTGGGPSTFNISSAAAIVASAAGARVAKHGNRAMTSKCGSADVLEQAGVRLHSDLQTLVSILNSTGIVFLFAQAHHPAMKAVAPIRKELPFRTIFNVLGPLTNPFQAECQLLGVYEMELVIPVAETLLNLGIRRGLVVHARDGLDEISPVAATDVAWVTENGVKPGVLQPEDFGLEPISADSLRPPADVPEAAAILREAISQPDSLRAKAILPSAAAALFLAQVGTSLTECAEIAQNTIANGSASAKLEELIVASNIEP